MISNRTHTPPPMIEELGDGTYHYNYNVVRTTLELEEDNFDNYDYLQVRCKMPVNQEIIQTAVNDSGSNHIVKI